MLGTPQGIIVFVMGSLMLILVMVFFFVKITSNFKKQQSGYTQTIESLKISYQNSLLQSQVEIQEQAFQNISHEIHDNIGQKLTLIKLILNTINITADNKVKASVNDSVNILSDVIADIRNINKSISSVIVSNNGLIKALEAEVAQLQKLKQYEISFSVTGDTIFLDSDKELIIFRIIQEALNNILKHSRATIIKVQLDYTKTCLILEISDNGIGFDKNKLSSGAGLYNMQKRTTLLNGVFSIESIRRRGTFLKIEIPYNKN